MPKSASGKAILGVLSLALAPLTGGASTFFMMVGINSLLAAGQQHYQENKRQDDDQQGVNVNFNGEESPLYLVFGEHRVGGHLSVMGVSGTNNEFLHLGISHSVAPSSGMSDITDVYFDETVITDAQIDTPAGTVNSGTYQGIATIKRYLGTDSETADGDFVSEISSQTSTSYGRGVARTHLKLERVDDDEAFRKAFPRGVPRVSAVVFGICYDSRLDSTNGGSGTHRANDPDTWEFSNNPALIAATYLIMDELDGGCGIDSARIDWTTVAAAANRCEETITVPDNLGGSTTQNRFTCNIVLDTGDPANKNMQKILSSMDGAFFTGLDGKLKIVAGEYDSPVTTIDETWIREGDLSVQRDRSDDEIYNAVRSRYIEPEVGYQPVSSVPYTNSTYESDDGRQEWRDIEIPGCTNRYLAQYLNQIEGKKSRHEVTAVLPLNYKGFDIEIWENVTLDIADMDLSGVFKVVNWKFEEQGPVVQLVEQNSDTWDVQFSDFTEHLPEPPPALVRETPPRIQTITATATADGIDITWDAIGSGTYSEIMVERSATSGSGFSKIGEVRGTYFRDPVIDGSTYYYRVRARSAVKTDTYSAYSVEASATAKTVADGADVTADNTGGRGVNLMNHRYCIFSESSLPAMAASNVSLTQTTNALNVTWGSGALQVTLDGTPGSDNCYVFMHDSTGSDLPIRDLPIRLEQGKKYIVSLWLFAAGSNSGSVTPTIRIRRESDLSYVLNEDLPTLTTTATRYTMEMDLTGASGVDDFVFSSWVDSNAGYTNGDNYYIDGVMIEEKVGNQTTASDFTMPPVNSSLDQADGPAEAGADVTEGHAADIVFRQAAAPSDPQAGWLWYDTDDSQKRIYRYSGSAWQEVGSYGSVFGSNLFNSGGSTVSEIDNSLLADAAVSTDKIEDEAVTKSTDDEGLTDNTEDPVFTTSFDPDSGRTVFQSIGRATVGNTNSTSSWSIDLKIDGVIIASFDNESGGVNVTDTFISGSDWAHVCEWNLTAVLATGSATAVNHVTAVNGPTAGGGGGYTGTCDHHITSYKK